MFGIFREYDDGSDDPALSAVNEVRNGSAIFIVETAATVVTEVVSGDRNSRQRTSSEFSVRTEPLAQ